MSKKMDNSISFGVGLLAGMVGGIIAGIVCAPRSGEESRADLAAKAKAIKNNFPKKIDGARKKSIRYIERTKASLENIIEDIQDSLRAKKMANAKILESKHLKEFN